MFKTDNTEIIRVSAFFGLELPLWRILQCILATKIRVIDPFTNSSQYGGHCTTWFWLCLCKQKGFPYPL